MATIYQQPKCCRCKRRFDVKTNDMVPLPDTWQCGKDDCHLADRNRRQDASIGESIKYDTYKPTKYHNQPTVVDGIKFRSLKEANRYGELKLLQKAGEIRELELQRRFRLDVEDYHICYYVADFAYLVATPARDGIQETTLVIEDAKGRKSTKDVAYRLFTAKKRLMKACLGIDVLEV